VAGSGGSARIRQGSFFSRYAGSMLLHAFTDRVNATDVFTSVAAPETSGYHFDDTAVLTGVSMLFSLGFKTMEQAKHPDRTQIGPLAGVTVLPELRTLRPRLAALADGCDPLALQRAFATAMLRADPCQSGVYFVDEHFMPYAGKLPVGKGYNTKRRRGEAGRVDTTVCDGAGRAVCFTTSEPSGLSVTLPAALAQLRTVTGPDAKIMLGFDRGGAYPSVFTTCRDAGADWITYRRGTLVTPTRLPVTATLTHSGKTSTITYADETVTITDYGPARQITLFEHGAPVLQILTSDTTACPEALTTFLRARWRIENLFKYLDFYGIDSLADYTVTIEANTRLVDNPARTTARTQLEYLTAERDALHGLIGALRTDPTIPIAELNRRSLTAQRKIHNLDKKITTAEEQLKTIPAKLPANLIDPDAKRAIHRTARRGLQMVLRLLAHNGEHWLAYHLNAYLQDPREYRATTRNLLHLAGIITYTPDQITVALDPPNTRRLTRALTLLLQEINNTPPHIPGDPRPITYTITQHDQH
jgi:Transposase DDE domain.